VTGDAHWLERLLLNVVDNAIKFTPPHGRVTIALMRDDTRARVEVRDTGIGMPPEVRARLFERFFQADPARSPAAEGFGLGLSLVKWIADRHDGRIDVVSEPGVGSVFTVYLPLARV
jgi:signal transduction histidine kinase